jgi:hypothetical protein
MRLEDRDTIMALACADDRSMTLDGATGEAAADIRLGRY